MSHSQGYQSLSKVEQEELNAIFKKKYFTLLKKGIKSCNNIDELTEFKEKFMKISSSVETSTKTEKVCECLKECECTFCGGFGHFHLMDGICFKCEGRIKSDSIGKVEKKLKINDCVTCQGSGFCKYCLHGDFRKCKKCDIGWCPDCKGKRRTLKKKKNIVKCFRCAGTGNCTLCLKDNDGCSLCQGTRKCDRCNGKGKVSKDELKKMDSKKDSSKKKVEKKSEKKVETNSKKKAESKSKKKAEKDSDSSSNSDSESEPDNKYKFCSLCKGNGKCIYCHGSGDKNNKDCSECDGDGICPRCDGDGKVIIKKDEKKDSDSSSGSESD